MNEGGKKKREGACSEEKEKRRMRENEFEFK